MIPPDARRYTRLNAQVPVDCTRGEQSFRAVAVTLSGGGLFLADVDELQPGAEIFVRFRPSKRLPTIQAKTVVLYALAGKGAAVAFRDISAQDHQVLLRVIHRKGADRRLGPRAPLATQIYCNECMSLAFSRDISLGGMFVESDAPPPVGSTISVRVNLGFKDRVVTAIARVAYHLEKMGMGIFFTRVEPEDFQAIREYIETVVTPDEPKAEKPS